MQLPSPGKRMKCVGAVGRHERKKRIRERKERKASTASIDLHFVTLETALLRYTWRRRRGAQNTPLLRPSKSFSLAETIENYHSDDGNARSRTFLPLGGATAAWLTTSQTHYVTLDHYLLDYCCQ